ncbi:MAG: Hsp20/alpha crystallin family protein [Bacilli bacterium]
MALVPYDPFGVLNRDSFPMLSRFVDDDWFGVAAPRIRADVRDTPTEVIVSADIPGLDKQEDVNIVVQDNRLYLSGRIERSYEEKGENVHRTERHFGQFARTISLPATVDESGAAASYRNGVLEIRIPKSQKAIGRRIDVAFH